MKLFYHIACIALTCFGSMNTLLANTFFAQVTHSEKAPNICEISSCLDYLNWSAMEELYKQVMTPASTQPPVPQKTGTAPQKISDTPLELFIFPKTPTARFWFWMSKDDTEKKENIQRVIEETKEFSTPRSAKELFEIIVKQGIQKKHKKTKEKALELLTASKSTPAIPFVENLVKQLGAANFDTFKEKMNTPSKILEATEKVIFWENIVGIPDPSRQLELLEQAPKSLLTDKECASFFQALTAKSLPENDVNQILQNPDFLRVLSDEMLKKMLQQKEKYALENFWLQLISDSATGKQHLDVEAINKKEAEFLEQLRISHERILFIKKNFSKIVDEKFSNIIEEKTAVHTPSEKLNTLEKK